MYERVCTTFKAAEHYNFGLSKIRWTRRTALYMEVLMDRDGSMS
jgi:hypothetical protein